MNSVLKLIGYKHNYSGKDRSYKFTWGEIYLWSKDFGFYWSGPYYCYQPKLVIQAYFFNIYIDTPSFGLKAAQSSREKVQYGIYLYPSLHDWQDTCFYFGKDRSWRWYMPWTYNWESNECLDHNLKTVIAKEEKSNRNWDKYYKESKAYKKNYARLYDYTYTLKNGEVQRRIASVTIERRTWYMRGWPWKKKIITSIDIAFDGEVGERAGSWKGGTIGCSYEMLPNETPEQCLRRMESERVFK
jgi:hypothetical protein